MSFDPYASGTEGNDYSIFNLPKGLKMYAPTKEGAVMFDIVPFKISSPKNWAITQGAKVGDEAFFANIHVHNNIGPNKKKVVCPNRTWGGKCPICEYQQEKGKELGWKNEEVKGLFPKQRMVFNIREIDAEGNKTEYLYDVAEFKGATPSFYAMVLAAADKVKLKRKLQNVFFADAKTGMSVEASVQMKDEVGGKKTKSPFATLFNISLTDRDEQYDSSIFKSTVDPMSIAKVSTYEELNRLFFGADDEEEDEGDEEVVDHSEEHGMNNEPDEVEEEEVVEEKPMPKAIGKRPVDADAPVCPLDLRFGKDFNKDDGCSDCDLYLDCRRANKALAK